MTLTAITEFEAGAIPAETYVDDVVLTASVPSIYTVPTGATKALIAMSADVRVKYLRGMATNIVTNGTMASDTGWTKGTGVTIGSGVMSFDGSQDATNGLTVQTPPTGYLVNGQAYYCTFTVTRSAGAIALVVGGTAGTSRSSASTFSEIIVAGSGTTIGFQPDADFVGTVDTVTFVPCATLGATANTVAGQGSVLNPTIRDIKGVGHISIISSSSATGSIAFYRDY